MIMNIMTMSPVVVLTISTVVVVQLLSMILTVMVSAAVDTIMNHCNKRCAVELPRKH